MHCLYAVKVLWTTTSVVSGTNRSTGESNKCDENSEENSDKFHFDLVVARIESKTVACLPSALCIYTATIALNLLSLQSHKNSVPHTKYMCIVHIKKSLTHRTNTCFFIYGKNPPLKIN